MSSRPHWALIEAGLLQRSGELLRDLLKPVRSSPLFVVTVRAVRRHWGKMLTKSLAGGGFSARVLEMPDGEPHKRLATVERLAQELVRLRADRDAVLVAFGGGVVGDTTGLLASLYMRGVNFINIPTTVLAQVDASIGGKTGVNLPGGKNLIGTFYQPLAVLIDPEVLSTLPEREFRAGLYECLKCGVIGNPSLFSRLANTELQALRKDSEMLEWVIGESVKLKASVVAADERENALRRVLNFGHTIGHALEAESGFRRFLHGEAVAWGMIAAAEIAQVMGCCDRSTQQRIAEAVLGLGPLPKVKAQSRRVLRLLQSDKKTRNGLVHFVLPCAIGQVEIVNHVPERVVAASVRHLAKLPGRN
ncbi:MAG TPA: 3-dehydroquinate synthase [Terriglobales bacterium]|nr:3-dehydroquinate synthase [Terriglobales bacterium]